VLKYKKIYLYLFLFCVLSLPVRQFCSTGSFLPGVGQACFIGNNSTAEAAEKWSHYPDQQIVVNDFSSSYQTDIYFKDGDIKIQWLAVAEVLGRSITHPIYNKKEEIIDLLELEALLGVELDWLPLKDQLNVQGLRVSRIQQFDISEDDDFLVFDFKLNYPVDSYFVQYDSPPKIVLDLDDLLLDIHQMKLEEQLPGPAVKGYRFQQLVDKARFVIDLRYKGPVVMIEEDTEENRIRLKLEQNFKHEFGSYIEDGVYYKQIRRGTADGPLMINKIKIDPRHSDFELRPVLADDRIGEREVLSQIAEENIALAGINGGFFSSSGMTLGLLIIDGEWVSEPLFNRAAVGITDQQELLFDRVGFIGEIDGLKIDGINRRPNNNELIMYNGYYGFETDTGLYGTELVIIDDRVVDKRVGSGHIPAEGYVLSGHGEKAAALDEIDKGSDMNLDLALPTEWEDKGVMHALGAGPRLLENGEINVSGELEQFQPSLVEARHPRTALGVDKYGDIIMISVGGRNPGVSVGLNLFELAELMKEFGVVEAINLDGGGSTTFLLRDRVMNIPSQFNERPVVNALLLLSKD